MRPGESTYGRHMKISIKGDTNDEGDSTGGGVIVSSMIMGTAHYI